MTIKQYYFFSGFLFFSALMGYTFLDCSICCPADTQLTSTRSTPTITCLLVSRLQTTAQDFLEKS